MARFDFTKPKSSKIKLKKGDMQKLSSFKVKKSDDGFTYLDAAKTPFVIGGIPHPDDNNGEYYRLDVNNKPAYSGANCQLGLCTAGGTVRFSTDADQISLHIKNRASIVGMHHFADRGVYGVDVYAGTGSNRVYVGEKMQTLADSPDENKGVINLPKGINEVTINLPLYGGIESLHIGFPEKSYIGAPTPRAFKPIAFYGSSITQGGCVSRPGNSYANIICRALDADCKNLGFSGAAMGELSIANIIGKTDLSCFVMDYDYNSPSHEHLRETHEPFYKRVRELNPNLPIVFVTHPIFWEEKDWDEERFDIVKETYKNAKDNGDKNVYFVDSRDFFPSEMRDLYAVDNLHPNDLGQYFMAKAIFPKVCKALDF